MGARLGLTGWRAAAGVLLFLAAAAWAQVAVPPLKSRVTDLTGTLSASQTAQLEERLKAFEAAKGSQVAVLIVPTARPEAIEQYSIRVAEEWKLGRKGVDDGVLLLVAKNDRELRIEVGRGLEGVLPDVTASRIIREIIVPRLREGDFFDGIGAGVERIIGVIEGEPLPALQPRAGVRSSGDPIEFVFLALVGIAMIGGILRAVLGRLLGSSIMGALAGAVAWIALASVIAGIVVGIVAFLIVLVGGTAGGSGRRGHWGGGGWSSGGGGGFSSGGGSFGGGGASGRW